jgi:large subunit ribosomal protein L25
MANEIISVEAELREPGSTNQAKRLRAAGKLPAVLYGEDRDPRPIVVSPRQIVEILQSGQGQNAILNLTVGEGKEQTALIHDYQVDPISHKLLHCDFKRISLDVAVEVTVPIHTVGEPKGVKQDGGVLDTVLREIDVRCLPTSIPDYLEVDVTELMIGDAVHVSDLPVPEGVELLVESDLTVATVAPPQELEIEEPEEEGLLGEMEEPEVIGKGGDEDEEASEEDEG